MAKGDLTLRYFGRSYTFTFSGSAITPSTQVFAVDDIVQFTTTGTLPTGLALNTSYYVVSVGATIQVAASEAGTPISLSGGSGVHSIRVYMSVVFNLFASDSPPPRQSSRLSGEGTFSVDGNFIDTGISFEDPQRYNIRAKVSIADALKLSAMWTTADKLRRETQTSTGSLYMELVDEITLYEEEGKTVSTKTRSSVGTPFQKNGCVYYYPKLQVKMPIKPTFSPDTNVGNVMAVFELQETGVKI
ncbi:MAG: hypothetical protein IM566_04240 [Pseudanabaena sp. M152S2SP2A07QC]|jgi:hypothetical protein|nr:hypothetical protein [Pseudanabaena sp. M109S1SP2A07QC]MCA6546633.1 hypothetical protein [Pseudanabaena sp. M152S2SP2A07QC]